MSGPEIRWRYINYFDAQNSPFISRIVLEKGVKAREMSTILDFFGLYFHRMSQLSTDFVVN